MPETAMPIDVLLLLAQLARRGLAVRTDGRRFIFTSPGPVLDDDLVTRMQRHRAELLRILPRAHHGPTAEAA